MKKVIYIILGLLLILVAFNFSKIKLGYIYYVSPCYYGEPIRQNHFPQVFLEVDLPSYYEEIQNLAQLNFKIDTLETVSYKNNNYPILELTKSTYNSEAKKLLIIAAVHGNESAGALAIPELLKEVNTNADRFKNWNLKIITPVNPVGLLAMSRYNASGCDLNRKFNSSNEKGVTVQKNTIDNYNPDVIINLHESPASGFLIHSNSILPNELLFKILNDVESKGVTLSVEDYFGRKLETAGNSKISGVLKFLNKVVKVEALGDYVTKKNIIEITTESGWNSSDEFQRINSHLYTILSVVDNYKL